MSVEIFNPPQKLEPLSESGYSEQEFYWVGHHEGDASEQGRYLRDHRSELLLYGGIHDDDANYSYDDFALVKAPNGWYLLETTGCSCPSPSETWRVEIGPTSLQAIKDFILGGHYDGYTLPKEQEAQFIQLIDSTMEAEKNDS